MAAELKSGFWGAMAASARRECAFLRGDAWSAAMVTWFPCLLLVVVAAIFVRGTLHDIPVAVVDHDHSPASRELVRRLDALQGVFVTATPASLDAAWSQVRRRDAYAVIYIPDGMSRQLDRGEQATVFSHYNASFMATGQAASREIAGAVQAMNAHLASARGMYLQGRAGAQAMPAQVQAVVMFNPEKSYEHFLISLLFPAILQLALCLGVVGALGRELRDGGGPAWLAACGQRPLAAIVGKLLPYLVLFTLYGGLGTAWVAARGGGIAGSAGMLLAGYVMMFLAYAGIGLLLVGATRSMVMALSLTGIYAGVAMAFSGTAFPTIEAPLFTRTWSELMPFTAFARLQSQQLDIGSHWVDSLRPLRVLASFVVVAGGPGMVLYARALKDPASWGRR